MPLLPALCRFTINQARDAHREWGFNCGPSALCAMLFLRPDELRPQLGEFERKGYMNPTMIVETLGRCGAKFHRTFRSEKPGPFPSVKHGLVRIQWGGRWCKPGVPMSARYWHTHWIGVCEVEDGEVIIFDINSCWMGYTWWVPMSVWTGNVIPWLCHDLKGWDKTWWATNAYEVEPRGREVAAA